MDNMLIVGCGGIGSWFIHSLCRQLSNEQLPLGTIAIADGDIVEASQLKYQNFSPEHIGANKSKSLSDKYEYVGLDPIHNYIDEKSDLSEYGIIVLCVDNDHIRRYLYSYCFANDKFFLDIRATGRRIMVIPKTGTLDENLKFVSDDNAHYSCQDPQDKVSGKFQNGHVIAAEIGIQMLLNHVRGFNIRPITLLI